MGGAEENPGGAVETIRLPGVQSCRGQGGESDFRRRAGPLARDIEEGDRPEGGVPGPEAIGIGPPAMTQSRDDARAGNNDALAGRGGLARWKKHKATNQSGGLPVNLSSVSVAGDGGRFPRTPGIQLFPEVPMDNSACADKQRAGDG